MADIRIPKQVFYGQLSAGGQLKHYKDHLKASLKVCEIDSDTWEVVATDRNMWWSDHHYAVEIFEKAHLDHLAEK